MNSKKSQPRFDPEVQQQVDRLLLEQNTYAPLELLLAESRLFYEDYEAWRNGEREFLDGALFGDPDRVREQLAEAADYAAALGLVPEAQTYPRWRGEGPLLRFSANPLLDRLFREHYQRPDGAVQMDLFMDNSGSVLAVEVSAALLAGHGAAAAEALDKLTRADAGHPEVGAFEHLLAARGELEQGRFEAEPLLERLEAELVPLAQHHLGGGRDYLVPFWRRLSELLKGGPFDPQRARLHASYSAGQAERWPAVLEAVAAEAAWAQQPELLLRAGHAAIRLRREPDFLLYWFRLCWLDGTMAERLAGLASREWLALWQAFLELEPELPIGDFPAWLLIRKPGLAQLLPQAPETAPPAFRLCLTLGRADTPGAPALLDTRQSLQQQAPDLFAHYMQAR